MNAHESENYLAISRSSSASKSVKIFWAEIYRGQLFFRDESSLIQSNCRSLRNLKSYLPRRNKNSCQYVRRDLMN
jgi:hypothetical protein